jgi:outer membrane receptor for ferrienterochelin and colicin
MRLLPVVERKREMTRLTGPQNSLLLGMLTILCVAQAPTMGYTEELSTQTNQALIPELELIKEEETVSIASRYEQPISQAPSNVYVITDEDIRHSGATDLPTVLRRIPGLEVMQMSGADFNVSARGNNQTVANKMLILVDGRSIYIDAAAQVYWKAIPVTLPEIKRIEVLKGPASALYGFNAFDGIISIITKSPEEMKGTTIQFGGGELGTITSAAIHAGVQGNLGYRLSVGRDQNQQWRNRDSLAFRSHKFNVQTEYALSAESKLSLSGGLVDVNRLDGPITSTVVLKDSPALGYTHLSYERPNFFVRAFWNSFDTTTDVNQNPFLAPFLQIRDRDGSSTSVMRGNTYNVETQHALDFGTMNRLTYGFNYRHNTLSGNFIDRFSREDRFGVYLQDEWSPIQSVTVVAGARYDLDTFIHATISPRLALLYTPIPDHTFRMTLSVAYRPPTIFETHADNQILITGAPNPGVNRGSEGLNPEEIVSYEVGYQGWFFKHLLRTRVNLFLNHISNLINFKSFGLVVSPINSGEADIYGGEAGIDFLATRWLTGFANYSYQEIGQTFTDTNRRGAPRFKINAGLRGEWENGLSGEIAFHHVGAATYPVNTAFTQFASFGGFIPPNERVGSYNLLNIRGAYKFWQQKAEAGYMRDAEVAISAFNALNDKHKEHPLGDTIGSLVMGWLTVRY